MKNVITFLRIAFWVGIIADAFMAVKLLLLPYNTNLDFRPEMETVASLMIGWTILLFWADRKPIERRIILLITIIMMTIGQIIYLVAIFLNKLSVKEAMTNGVPPLIVLSFFAIVYFYTARELKRIHGNA